MNRTSQLHMPRFDRVAVVEKKRKSPEPSRSSSKMKKFELLHRPFDLKFRGKVSRWLESIERNIGFPKHLEESYALLDLYFKPQRKRWLTQAQVCRKLRRKSTRKLSIEMRQTLLVLWHKIH
ncbi:hypothetical protein ACFL2C_03845 [Patescibacteria group bacterium]